MEGPEGKNDEIDPTEGLNLRIYIQEKFGTRGESWLAWIFERIRQAAGQRILDLGCGPGTIWVYNAAQIPETWQVILSDADIEMVREARGALEAFPRAFLYCTNEAGAIPLADASVDLLLAIGLFDIVPELPATMAEAWRVLAPGGRVLAATGSNHHLHELEALIKPIEPSAQLGKTSSRFSMENGAEQLSSRFRVLEQGMYTDTLTFTNPTPILMYYQSESDLARRLKGKRLDELLGRIRREIETQGSLRVTVEKGTFLAQKSG
ncbi:MAG TPA: class I SAM-dependent methyltransferase [Anaerolineaceae bacterium]|nr:class I SAM-dependent methyltransferase [Anaerolineaceae bacterium]